MTETITASYCGYARHADSESTWDVIHDGVGNNSASVNRCMIDAYSLTADRWNYIERSFIVFDTSHLGNLNIKSGALKLYNTYGLDGFLTTTNPTLNAYSVEPESYTSAHDGDYTKFGSTPFSAPVSILAFYNLPTREHAFTLNQLGLANINKNGYTAFGLRVSNDVNDSPPIWDNNSVNYIHFAWDYSAPTLPELILETGDVIEPIRDWVTQVKGFIGQSGVPSAYLMQLTLGGLPRRLKTDFPDLPEQQLFSEVAYEIVDGEFKIFVINEKGEKIYLEE